MSEAERLKLEIEAARWAALQAFDCQADAAIRSLVCRLYDILFWAQIEIAEAFEK